MHLAETSPPSITDSKSVSRCQCRSNGCAPAFLAYGHHPLSTVLHPDIPFWQKIDRSSTLTLYGMLSQHGVQAHVNGHLHSAFGQRVHMLHKTRVGGEPLLLCCAVLCYAVLCYAVMLCYTVMLCFVVMLCCAAGLCFGLALPLAAVCCDASHETLLHAMCYWPAPRQQHLQRCQSPS